MKYELVEKSDDIVFCHRLFQEVFAYQHVLTKTQTMGSNCKGKENCSHNTWISLLNPKWAKRVIFTSFNFLKTSLKTWKLLGFYDIKTDKKVFQKFAKNQKKCKIKLKYTTNLLFSFRKSCFHTWLKNEYFYHFVSCEKVLKSQGSNICIFRANMAASINHSELYSWCVRQQNMSN